MGLHVSTHPLTAHLLTVLRDVTTPPSAFRSAARTLSTILSLEATADLESEAVSVQTPLEVTKGSRLENGLAAVPILRAGLSMLEPLLELFPDVAVGYIGLERDHETAEASRYYCKLPKLDGKVAVCLDPMLATGGSAAKAIELIKEGGPKRVVMVSVVAAPEGVEKLQAVHPDVPIYTAGLDRQLNPNKYILPGLGDYGDRLYGTQ
ncbi:MAG: uracil phosphoribosyltransferase [Armatimonadetes bacterium]|nr:uracil phosphoribosyltransferase [Armatimonadota bacterium]